ncbi:MAG TPA: V-type ATPase 116kDa subunit family protein, partial [Spirochaetia bacterium]|nr:V-type ATPase 116kDa subunit family protein [Spirochaetia bacterium]
YAAGVWVAWFYVTHEYRELPSSSLLLVLLGLPALLLGAKPVVEFFIEKREHGKKFGAFTIVDILMGWIVEILELSTRYLSNTLSFMRVAGLGIAHVSLMIAFFDIARLAGGGHMNLWSIVVLLFGNLLVIVLEGLSAGIQALRLNYYEFFSKFFSGTGRAYAPISLKSRN